MIWIVGKVFDDFSEYLLVRHIEYGIFTDGAKSLTQPDGIAVINLDFSSEQALIQSLDALPEKPNVTGVMTAGYEHYIVPASWISKYFSVPGPTPEAAVAATDKAVMRQKFQSYNPAITPAFMAVHSWQDIATFMTDHPFPLMLKPTNLMKSMFVSKNLGAAELRSNYDEMQAGLEAVQQSLQMREPSGVIIEECMAGTMHTVAGFVNASFETVLLPEVADCITAQELGRQDNYLYSRQLPSSLSQRDTTDVLAVAQEGIKALGVQNVPLHIELMFTTTGPKIIEIGARIGGYRARMYSYAYGYNVHQAVIDTALNKAIVFTPEKNNSCAVIELFPDSQGTFKYIENTGALQQLASLQSFNIKKQPGTKVGPASKGFRAIAIIMLGHSDPEQFSKDLRYVRSSVRVVCD